MTLSGSHCLQFSDWAEVQVCHLWLNQQDSQLSDYYLYYYHHQLLRRHSKACCHQFIILIQLAMCPAANTLECPDQVAIPSAVKLGRRSYPWSYDVRYLKPACSYVVPIQVGSLIQELRTNFLACIPSKTQAEWWSSVSLNIQHRTAIRKNLFQLNCKKCQSDPFFRRLYYIKSCLWTVLVCYNSAKYNSFQI